MVSHWCFYKRTWVDRTVGVQHWWRYRGHGRKEEASSMVVVVVVVQRKEEEEEGKVWVMVYRAVWV